LDAAGFGIWPTEENWAGDTIKAGNLLLRALELSPAYLGARAAYAGVLAELRDHMAAYHECAHLLTAAPDNFRNTCCSGPISAVNIERFDEAKKPYDQAGAGKTQASGAAAIVRDADENLANRDEAARTFPDLADALSERRRRLLCLNELRANHLTTDDVAQMMQRLAAGVPIGPSRRAMAYALAQDRWKAWASTRRASRLMNSLPRRAAQSWKGRIRPMIPPRSRSAWIACRRTFTGQRDCRPRRQFPPANPATTPIFVMGMVRAGSTLVEQILASHDQVEGTRELPVYRIHQAYRHEPPCLSRRMSTRTGCWIIHAPSSINSVRMCWAALRNSGAARCRT